MALAQGQDSGGLGQRRKDLFPVQFECYFISEELATIFEAK